MALDLSEQQVFEQLVALIPSMTREEKDKAYEWIEEYQIKLARKDFYVFLKLMAPLIIPDEFKDGAHLRLFCRELMALQKETDNGNKQKLQMFLPPGAMKTLTLCLFVAWCFGKNPGWRVIHIGHTAKFAEDNFGQRIRDLVITPEYRKIFPEVKLSKSAKGKAYWKTTKGGEYYCTGVGNAIAGRRGNITICDDVISEQTAFSDTEREKINQWYVPGLRTRLLPGGSEIITNTRWALNDLSGFILEKDKEGKSLPWKVIKIPAILDKESADLLKLPEGESFWPELQPLDFLLEKKHTIDKGKWEALYMQTPIPAEGNLFKDRHFRNWEKEETEPPKCSYILASFDTAFSKSEHADYTAFSVWGVFDRAEEDFRQNTVRTSHLILLDADKGKWDFGELLAKIKEVWRIYTPDALLIENKASGQSVLQELANQGLPVVPYNPDRDKISRANAALPFFENGRIWVPESQDFARMLTTDALQFPQGDKDLIDSMTQAVLYLRDISMLWHGDYKYKNDVDEDEHSGGRFTYWKAVSK